MFRKFSIPLACLGAALACDTPTPHPPRSFREFVVERRRADPRPDSFSLAADRGRVLGAATAPVWLVVVSDFQCPICKQWYDEVFPVIRREYVATGKVRVGYINMPQAAHLNGMPTALAAACASAQGKFWETSVRIFETQKRWDTLPDARPFLDSLAIAAGAEPVSLRICTERARATKLVLEDVERGKAAGVNALPAFFIGKHKLLGATSVVTFRAVIDSALAGQ